MTSWFEYYDYFMALLCTINFNREFYAEFCGIAIGLPPLRHTNARQRLGRIQDFLDKVYERFS